MYKTVYLLEMTLNQDGNGYAINPKKITVGIYDDYDLMMNDYRLIKQNSYFSGDLWIRNFDLNKNYSGFS